MRQLNPPRPPAPDRSRRGPRKRQTVFLSSLVAVSGIAAIISNHGLLTGLVVPWPLVWLLLVGGAVAHLDVARAVVTGRRVSPASAIYIAVFNAPAAIWIALPLL